MNKKNKNIIAYFILFSLMIVLGVIYAILQANLQINGTAKISSNTWDVHFDNIVVNPDSVSIGTGDFAATIDPTNDCKVDFSVTLSLPGDFYEFTVDVVNAGTIDGMIGTFNKTLKVNNVVVDTVPEYLSYVVTYEDDTEILENQILVKNTFETYKVRIEFRSDIDTLPPATTILTSLEPTIIQADSGAIKVNHPITGVVYANTQYTINYDLSNNTDYYLDYNEVPLPYFFVYDVEENIIKSIKLGVRNNNKIAVLVGGTGGTSFDSNSSVLYDTFDSCEYSYGYLFCRGDSYSVSVFPDDDVCAGTNSNSCRISSTGDYISCGRYEYVCRGG